MMNFLHVFPLFEVNLKGINIMSSRMDAKCDIVLKNEFHPVLTGSIHSFLQERIRGARAKHQ